MIEWLLGFTTWSPLQQEPAEAMEAMDSMVDPRTPFTPDNIHTPGMSAEFPATSTLACLQLHHLITAPGNQTLVDVQIVTYKGNSLSCRGGLFWCGVLTKLVRRRLLSSRSLRISLHVEALGVRSLHTADPHPFHLTSLSNLFSGGSHHGRRDSPSIRFPCRENDKLLEAAGTTTPTRSDQEDQEYIVFLIFRNKNILYTKLEVAVNGSSVYSKCEYGGDGDVMFRLVFYREIPIIASLE
jgi:hypothetical protein